MTSLPFSCPRSFPCNFLPLPCRGGWLGAAGCSPEPAKAMPTTALPAQHLHSLGKLLHCQGSLGSICHPELHSRARFPRMRLQALFPWWGTLQETAQLLVGAWEAGRIPVVAVPLSKFQLLPPGLLLAVVVQLSSAPCAPLDYFPPRFPRAQSEINSCLGSCP